MMQKRANAVTFKGNPLSLVGPQLKVGDKAPDFALPGSDGKTTTSISSVVGRRTPSVRRSGCTPSCAIAIRARTRPTSRVRPSSRGTRARARCGSPAKHHLSDDGTTIS